MGSFCSKSSSKVEIMASDTSETPVLTAEQAKNQLRSYDRETIRLYTHVQDEIEIETIYLAHLCQRGDLEAIVEFVNNRGNVEDIVNLQLYQLWGGTVLHMVTVMNKGQTALDIIRFLVEQCGADWYADSQGHMPWDTASVGLYVSVADGTLLGERDPKEFKDTSDLILQYYMDTFRFA